MSTGEPCAAPANAATKVAGGQTIRSALPTKSLEPAMIRASSVPDAASPFIFQFPATSGTILAIAINHPLCLRLSGPVWQSQTFGPGPIRLQLQGVGPVTMVRAARLG